MVVTSSVGDGAAWITSAGIICPHFVVVVVVVVYMVVYILYVLLLYLMLVSKK